MYWQAVHRARRQSKLNWERLFRHVVGNSTRHRRWVRPSITRCFAVDTSTSSAFDRELKTRQRDNAARAQNAWKDGDDVVDYNYFRQEMAYRLVDRLDDIKREEGFPLALDIGAYRSLASCWTG